MAVYCWLIPMPRVRPSGVTTMELMVGAVTVREVEPLMLPRLAEIVVEPAAAPTARPAAFTVAAAVEEELQFTNAVRSRVLPSL